jgi:hypothetical protein
MKYLLLLVTLFCKPSIPAKPIQLPNSKDFQIHFSYGEIETSRIEKNEESQWYPIFQEKNNQVCITSNSYIYREKEFGPGLDFCSSVFLNDLDYFKTFFESQDETLNLHYENGVEVSTVSLNEIISSWKEEPPKFLMVGDRLLEKERFDSGIKPDLFYTIYGNEKNINSVFSMPYFTFWRDFTHWRIAFPKKFIGGRKTSIKYLIFSIPLSLLSDFNELNISNHIERVHSKIKQNCITLEPAFTEYNPISSSLSAKFIEWKNPNKDPICITEYKIGIGEKFFEQKNSTGFYFPGETVLIGEDDSKYQIHTEIPIDWKELKQNSKLTFITNSYNILWEEVKNKSIKYIDGEASIKFGNKQCSSVIDLSNLKNLCSDPGIDLQINSTSCDLNSFVVTEINSNGINSNSTGNYIEFKYTGKSDCDLSEISFEFADRVFPISISKRVIKSNTIFVLGSSEYFEKIEVVDRDIRTLSEKVSFFIFSNNQRVEVFSPTSINKDFFLKDSNGFVNSIHLDSSDWKTHIPYISDNIKEGYKNNINGSPGEIVLSSTNLGKGTLSEINIYGSYSNDDSYPQDKFLEIDLESGTDYILKIYYSSNINKIYYLPNQSKGGRFVFGKNKLVCFPDVAVYLNENFTLSKDIQKIELLSKETIVDSLEIDTTTSLGLEDRNLKIRKSLSRVENSNIWKNSYSFSLQEKSSPNCFPYTHSTPGVSNSYSPFIKKYTRFEPKINYFFEVPLNTSIPFFDYSIYSNSTDNKFIYGSISILNKNLEEEKDLSIFETDSILYLKWKDTNDLNVILPNSLRIQSVLPLPTNPQNEWVSICNYGIETEYIKNYEIQDSVYYDKLMPYGNRFPLKNPLLGENENFIFNKDFLSPGECGYIIDPDATNLVLKDKKNYQIPIFTVLSDSTIGNGIASDEYLNLYKIKNNAKILVSSYGNQFSHLPFKIKLLENEIAELKEGKTGEGIYDYRIIK